MDVIYEIDALTGKKLSSLNYVMIFPASHYAMEKQKILDKIPEIRHDLMLQEEKFRKEDKLLEAERIHQRTLYDIEMLSELGYCSGIENYSRYFDGRNIFRKLIDSNTCKTCKKEPQIIFH